MGSIDTAPTPRWKKDQEEMALRRKIAEEKREKHDRERDQAISSVMRLASFELALAILNLKNPLMQVDGNLNAISKEDHEVKTLAGDIRKEIESYLASNLELKNLIYDEVVGKKDMDAELKKKLNYIYENIISKKSKKEEKIA